MKIAIIGSGIAGLTVSHLLQKDGHEVHLYESQAQLGMSAHTIDLTSGGNGLPVFGDVPSRMFNAALWPSVMKLYQSLGIAITSIDAKQSYRQVGDESALQFKLPFEWSNEIAETAKSAVLALAQSVGIGESDTTGTLVEASRNTRPIGGRRSVFLSEINRLRAQGLQDLKTLDRSQSFGEYLDQNRFSEEFRNVFLFPALSSTVCTCSHEAISKYPAVILLEAMQHITGDQRLCRVEKGARLVSERLSECANVNLSTPVREVDRAGDRVAVAAGENRREFDHVVIAVQANQAAHVCSGLSASESAVLGGFQYEDVDVVVHTDEQFMPEVKNQWAVFNFVANSQNHESMCTVWMNQFHTNWRDEGVTQPVFQTIRPFQDVRSGKLIRRAKLQRPLVTDRSWEFWQRLREIHREKNRRIWFCGSYAMPGIPLLESAVRSAIEISNAISNAS